MVVRQHKERTTLLSVGRKVHQKEGPCWNGPGNIEKGLHYSVLEKKSIKGKGHIGTDLKPTGVEQISGHHEH